MVTPPHVHVHIHHYISLNPAHVLYFSGLIVCFVFLVTLHLPYRLSSNKFYPIWKFIGHDESLTWPLCREFWTC